MRTKPKPGANAWSVVKPKPPGKAKRAASIGIVVFGKDEAGKPHASLFSEADAPLATKAAGLMGMQVLRPVSTAASELAAKLPKGRVFASGRGFVPFVRLKLYEALLMTHADPENQLPVDASAPSKPIGSSDTPPSTDASLIDLKEGTVVLAPAAPDEGWWEAVVVKAKGDLLTLRWRDYPDDPPFARRRNQIALFDFASAPSGK
jgi:hypothetical protein